MARKPRLRALVLAAGFGTRLRPLTDAVPKALLPVAGVPIVGRTLSALAAAGCEAAAVNLHHLGEDIRRALGDSWDGMPLTYSEEAEILGTLGALAPLAGFLGEADVVLVVNGDSLCRWPLRRLVRRHLASGVRATLLLAAGPDPEPYGGGVGVSREGRVVSFGPRRPAVGAAARRLVFAGAHALSPALLSEVPARRAEFVADLYEPLLARGGAIAALATARPWHDLGTPARYLEGLLDWVARRGLRLGKSWTSGEATLGDRVRHRRAVVEAGAEVGDGARLEGSLVLPGARIGEGAELVGTVVGFGTQVPAGARIQGRLVTALRRGWQAGPRDTVVGEVAYRPLA